MLVQEPRTEMFRTLVELVNRLKPAVWGTFKILNNQGGAVKLPVGKKKGVGHDISW